MTDPLLTLCEGIDEYLEACSLGAPVVPILCRSKWSRLMVARWTRRQGLSTIASDQSRTFPRRDLSSWKNPIELQVLSLESDTAASTIAQAFVRTRSATAFAFPTWDSASKHQLAQNSVVHTVIVGVDRMPSMRDLALFGEQVGHIAVDTLELASFVLAKTLVHSMMPEGRDLCFAPIQKGSATTHTGALTVLPAGSPELKEWRSLVRGDESVVSIVGHASEDYLRLSSDELICGLRTVRPPDSSGSRVPTCMIDGGCVLPGLQRSGAEDIPGAVFFANACLTLKVDGGVFAGGDSYTVSQRFLEANAAAFVASPLLKDGRLEENLVFHGLMAAGLTIGQATKEINRFLLRWGFEAGKVTVLGDPSFFTSTGLVDTEPKSIKKGLLFGADDRASVQADEDCCVEGVPARATTGFIRGENIPRDCAVLIDRALDAETVDRIRIVERAITPEAALRRIRTVLDEYDRTALLGVKIDEGRQLLTDFRKNYPNVVRRAATSRCGAPLDQALGRVLDRLDDATRTLDSGLVAKLQRETLKSEYHFVEAYRDAYKVLRVDEMTEGCPNCGSDAIRYEFVAFGDAEARRWLISCVVCGAVQDGVPDFVITQITPLTRGLEQGTLNAMMHLRNESSRSTNLAIGGAVTHGRRHKAEVSVSHERLHLEPGQNEMIGIDVRVPQPEDRHPMFLRMYSVSEGKVSFSGREFFI